MLVLRRSRAISEKLQSDEQAVQLPLWTTHAMHRTEILIDLVDQCVLFVRLVRFANFVHIEVLPFDLFG